MVRRISTTVAALSMAMLIYAIIVGALASRIKVLTGGQTCIHSSSRPCPNPAAHPGPAVIRIGGVAVSISSLAACALTLAMMPLLAEYMTHLRRRLRYH